VARARLVSGCGEGYLRLNKRRHLDPDGIRVNGQDVPSGESVPLHDGDRINLGAWNQIIITRA
jgi:hypothetical protein